MKIEIAKAVQAAGFDVYMKNGDVDKYTWLFYSDPATGAIGYLQKPYFGDGVDISTLHKPTTSIGSGFRALENVAVTAENLRAGLAVAPPWWRGSTDNVRKYADIEQYRRENPFNAEYTLVEKL